VKNGGLILQDGGISMITRENDDFSSIGDERFN
jgi:hypothetical protein